MLLHNEKVKDECLKKVSAYKDKYTDYKNKVKQANQQISQLTQRVARFELEKAHMMQSSPYREDASSQEWPSQIISLTY